MIDAIVFAVAAAICLIGALGVILAKNPVHSALMLVMTLFGIAVQFVALEAHFLAAVQVIVYAGAIVVLFLFVIMLLGVDKATDLEFDSLQPQKYGAAMFLVGGVAIVAYLATTVKVIATGRRSDTIDESTENVVSLARSLFSDYVYAFELTSLLLVIAVIGAVVLAKKPKADEEVG